MKYAVISLLNILATARLLCATEFQVAISGNDANLGTQAAPLRTIQHAADLAQPGDVITVHEGVYRERINPPRGGESDAKRIVYRAAPGEKVVITGAEPVKNWVRVTNDTWKVTLPNSFFGAFNPYGDLIHGDWFNPKGREHHTGAVYLDGDWLVEAAKLDEVLMPPGNVFKSSERSPSLWFGQVERDNTTVWAQFKRVDPNVQNVEVNVRKTVFYPLKTGINYLTVRGFLLRDAATPWAPPTAEQVGLIGTHWSKGWIIESNDVSYSICSGISLGKHGDAFDNTSADSAEGYVKTIERAHAHSLAWTKENIGGHIVRDNTISHCEQAGIVGSLGCSFSTVTGNVIHDIHMRKLFTGAEMAGIKFHGAIDTEISHNRIWRTCRGLWLDWMAQGTRVSGNLFYDNADQDLFVEVNHGPFLVDNNLFLSGTTLLDVSEGGAYAHNLIAGRIVTHPELKRDTPFHPAHSTAVAGLSSTQGGDDRFFNNVFVGGNQPAKGYGLAVYDNAVYPLLTGGNVYGNGARPYAKETNALVLASLNPGIKVAQEGNRVFVSFSAGQELKRAVTRRITPQLLGETHVSKLGYENADVSLDYFGVRSAVDNPTPGPFQNPAADNVKCEVW